MKTDTDHLSPRQRRAIAALLQSRTAAEAAQVIGVTDRTLRRWLADERFVSALRAAEADLIEQAARRLAQLAGVAIDALIDVLNDTEAPPAPRVSAANVSLSQLFKVRELHDLEQRIARLEQINDQTR